MRFERHDAVELLVAGDEDLAQGTAFVEADYAVTAIGVEGGAVGLPVRGGFGAGLFAGGSRGESDQDEASLEVEVW